MKKVIVACALVLAIVSSLFLTACGSGSVTDAKQVNMIDILADEPKEQIEVKSIENLNLVGDIVSGEGNFFYTKKVDSETTTYAVYDARTLSSVYTHVEDSATEYKIDDINCYNIKAEFFTVTLKKDTEIKTQLIYSNGSVVATENHQAEIGGSYKLFEKYGLFTFDDDAYRQTDNGITLIRKSEHGFTTFDNDEIIICGDKYFWIGFDEERLVAYDLTLNPVTEYKAPTFASSVSVYGLAKDNILIQYMVQSDPYAVDYDVMLYGVKYHLYQKVYSAETKKETNIYLGGLVRSCMDVRDSEQFKENRVSTIAYVSPIEDKYVNENGDLYSINENGAITEKFITPNDLDYNQIIVLGQNRYVLQNAYIGASQIIDKSGKVYGSFDNYDETLGVFTNIETINLAFIQVEDKIYDFDFNEIYVIKENDEVIFANSSVYIKSYDEDGIYYDAYIIKKGATAPELICSYSETSENKLILDSTFALGKKLYSYLYAVKENAEGVVTYKYYSEKGNLLLESQNALSVSYFASGSDVVVLSYLGADDQINYFVAK